MKPVTFLVPYDFTSVTESAAKDAVTIAKQTKARVLLLHIIKNKKDKETSTVLLKSVATELSAEGVEVDFRVEVGNIFDDIGRVAKEVNAFLIIMGTHGAKGMQKLFGSWAIKVITSTDVPFMVVQEKVISKEINKIVMPITASKESLQILPATAKLAKAFGASVEVVYEAKSDVGLQRKIKNYAQIALMQLTEQGVKETKAFKLSGKDSYQQQIIDFSLRHGADLISIAYYTEKVFAQFDTFAQEIITNKHQIPTLITKTVDSTIGYY